MWRNLKKNLTDLERDDLLELVGLESRRSKSEVVVPSLALFGAGVLVGIGLGLAFAPKSGRQLREGIDARLKTKDEVSKAPAANS